MKVAILFPNTESSRLVSTRLLENGYEVVFFCPDKLDIEIAQNYIFELNIIGREQDMQRQRENSFSVEKNDLSDCEVLVIPWIDIKIRGVDYSDLCFNLFSMLQSRAVSFSPNAKVIFGHNVSGLVAAKEWGRVWPAMKEHILVTCSVFRASQKIYGIDSDNRAIPVERNPVKIIYSTDACEEVRAMEGRWTNTSFVALETRLLYDLVSLIKKKQPYDSLGLLGRYTKEEEGTRFDVPANSVF